MEKPYTRIPQSFIQELVARTDLVEIIRVRVKLKKSGAHHQGLCPFHTEKTPSFSVSNAKQYYHCFGCGVHGNVIDFLMNYERMHFLDVIETLAAQAGMPVPTTVEQTQQQQALTHCNDLLKAVANDYHTNLFKHPAAQTYLKKRQLETQVIKQFALGFAPKSWDYLLKRFGQSAEKIKQLAITGMLVEKASSNNTNSQKPHYYDRFRERIMFPIRDYRGRVVGFGGRTLGDDIPKYLNSPETPFFQKSKILYGLFEAKQVKQKLDTLIVVEGYMDVIALAQHDIPYAVATLGTALSSTHIQQIFRHTTTVVFCFDGDKAGAKAAWRALEITLPLMRDGLEATFMFLPENKDPDDLVRQIGKTGFLAELKKAPSLADFFFDRLSEDINPNTIAGQSRFAKRAMSLIGSMPEGIFKTLMLEKLAAHLEIEETKLASLLIEKKSAHTPPPPGPTIKRHQGTTLSPGYLVIALLIQYPHLGVHISDKTDSLHHPLFQHHTGLSLLSQIMTQLKQTPNLTTAALLEYFRESEHFGILQSLAIHQHILPENRLKDELVSALKKVQSGLLEKKIQTLLKQAQKQPLTTEEKKLLQELIRKKTGRQDN